VEVQILRFGVLDCRIWGWEEGEEVLKERKVMEQACLQEAVALA
jgi:hypothetical protein